MKFNLKDLLQHKFPMDETEQAIFLDEISTFAKELHERYSEIKNKIPQGARQAELEFLVEEILGE